MQEGKDLTKGNLFKNMLMFSFPLLITNLLNSFYNIVDGMWVGKLVGDEGVATITNCWPILLVASSVQAAINVTTSVMVAQRYSSKDRQSIKSIITPLYAISVILGLITTTILILSLDFWLDLFNTPVEIIQMSKSYLQVFLIGYIFNFLAMAIIEAIRAMGNSKSPLILLTISMVANVILDPILILAGFGVAGAAAASTLAMLIGLIVNIIYVKRKSPLLHFSRKHLKFEKNFLIEAVKLGVPMMVEELSTIVTIMSEVFVSNSLGVIGSSAYGVISKLQQIIWIIGGTIRTLLTVVVGQFIGKGDYKELKSVIKNGVKLIIVPNIFIILFMVFLSRPFCYIFTDNLEVIEVAIQYLKIVGIAFALVPICQLLYGFILGTGNTRYTFLSCALASALEVFVVFYIYYKYNKPLEAMGFGIIAWYILLIALCYLYIARKYKNELKRDKA